MSTLIKLLFEPQALLVWNLSHDHGLLTVEGEIEGRPAHVIVPPAELSSLLYSPDRPRVVPACEALIARAKLLNIEVRLLDPAGEPHWFHIVGRVWQSAPQAAAGPFVGGTARSINLQKQHEQRDHEQQAQLPPSLTRVP